MFRRLLAAAIILAVSALLLVAAWPQLFGLHRTIGVAQVVSLRGAAIAVALALVVAILLLCLLVPPFRSLGASLAVLVTVFVAVSAVVLASRGFGPGDSIEADQRPESAITVLAWNTLGPATEPSDIADLALEVRAQVVVLPETRQEDAVAAAVLMRDAGAPMWVLTTAYDLISPARSTAMLVSTELGEYRFDPLQRTTTVLPSVVATPVDGTGPTLIGVHAVAPVPAQMENWRDDLELLATLCSGDNVIMAGDFNATIDHFSGLGSWDSTTRDTDRMSSAAKLGECTDAASAAGAGAVGTWPTSLPGLLGAPIDHVLVTDEWRVDGFRVVDDRDGLGSDHRPVVAVLEPAAG